MRTFSIKRRIVTAVVGAELLLVISLMLLAGYLIRHSAMRGFDATLQGRAMSVAALVRYSEGPHPELQFDSSLMPRPLTEGVSNHFQIETSDGRIIAASTPPPQLKPPNRAKAFGWKYFSDGVPYRAIRLPGVPVLDSEDNAPKTITLNVTYASTTRELNKSLSNAFILILLVGIFLLAVSVYASIRAVERGLQPLAALAASATSISATDWDLKLAPSTLKVQEIEPLAGAMTRMLESLHQAFEQQRDFTSNAAHELKTPVAVLKSTLQSLSQEPRSGEVYRAGIADALLDLARLEALLHSMLRLARAEQQVGTGVQEFSNVDVVSTCETAIARLTPLAQNRGTKISLSASNDTLQVRAEPEDLEIVWANLLENAIRYSPPNSEVRVITARRNGIVSVAVEDHGPGIPAEEIPKIFDRFHRGDHSRSRDSGGYGLGLAIAKAFVERYGGAISASAVEPTGTRIGIELPVSH